ncbi:TetR/AcrR family transcriptional regulator [Streptomyces mirabilis]
MGRPRSFDKTAALHAAEHQFRKTGYAGTSLDDIAAATGLWRNSLRTTFGDKRTLFLKTLEEYCTVNEAGVASALSGPDSEALERLHWFLMLWAHLVVDDDDRLGCMVTRFAVELNGSDPAADRRIAQDYNAVKEAITGCVEAAQRHGDLDADASAPDIACMIWTVTRGLDVAAKSGMPIEDMEAVARLTFETLPFTAGRGAAAAPGAR